MRNKNYIFKLLIVGLVLFGCEKYQLKQPTSLSINWKMTENSPELNQVELTDGKVFSEVFSVEGQRVKGDDVIIEQTFPTSIISFNSEQNLGLLIDVPVGNYTTFKVKLSAIENTDFAFEVNGIYHTSTENLPVHIVWNQDKMLEFINKNSFELTKTKTYNCFLELNRQLLFQDVSVIQWEQASITMENDVPTIVISKDFNTNIFNDINDKLNNSLQLSVN